jgi:hypothetical protein
MSKRRQEYIKYIQQMVESLDVYQNETQRRLYHIGFLTGYLAKVLERDPFLLREFEEQIEAIREDKK